MNYEEMLYRAAEDRRLYELEQRRFEEARWLQQQRAEQQRVQYAEQEWRRTQGYRLHQEQQQSNRPRDGWPGEACNSGRSRDACWQGGAQAGTARDNNCPQPRVLKKPRVVKEEENFDEQAAAPSQDHPEPKKKPPSTRVVLSGAIRVGSDSCLRKGKDESIKDKEYRVEDREEEQYAEGEVEEQLDGDGEAAGNPNAVTSENLSLPPIDMAKYEESCQHLMRFLVKGPAHILNDVNHKDLISLQHSARSFVELVDRAAEAAVERDLRAAAAEKEEVCRQRDVALAERSALENEMSRLKQAQAAEMVAQRQTHEAALDRLKQEQDSMRKQLDTEQHKAICKICLVKPRNAVLLPCMHFDYCLECLAAHQTKHNTCPSCRGSIQGILQCNLGL